MIIIMMMTVVAMMMGLSGACMRQFSKLKINFNVYLIARHWHQQRHQQTAEGEQFYIQIRVAYCHCELHAHTENESAMCGGDDETRSFTFISILQLSHFCSIWNVQNKKNIHSILNMTSIQKWVRDILQEEENSVPVCSLLNYLFTIIIIIMHIWKKRQFLVKFYYSLLLWWCCSLGKNLCLFETCLLWK